MQKLRYSFILLVVSFFYVQGAAWAGSPIKMNDFLDRLYAKAGLSSQIAHYSGALCANNPQVGFARTNGLLTLSSCPSPTAKITLAQVYEAIYKTYLYTHNDSAKMRAYILAYDGIDINGINKPYGVLADPYKFSFMTDSLVRESMATNPYDTNYGKIAPTQDEAQIVINDYFNEEWLAIFQNNSDDWWQPSKGLTWEIQLQGGVDTSMDVEAMDIDLFDSPRSLIDAIHQQGKMVICYFSAGSYENWRPDAKSFVKAVRGRSNGWAGENWLDIRNTDILAPIMTARFDVATIKGCDAIDTDNVDGYTNKTGFPLSYQDQLNYNLFLADQAHERGMAIGLKNDLNQIPDLVDIFDFAINESCYDYNECHLLDPFIAADKPVLGIEYNLPASEFCDDANQKEYSFLKKGYDLSSPGQACWNNPSPL